MRNSKVDDHAIFQIVIGAALMVAVVSFVTWCVGFISTIVAAGIVYFRRRSATERKPAPHLHVLGLGIVFGWVMIAMDHRMLGSAQSFLEVAKALVFVFVTLAVAHASLAAWQSIRASLWLTDPDSAVSQSTGEGAAPTPPVRDTLTESDAGEADAMPYRYLVRYVYTRDTDGGEGVIHIGRFQPLSTFAQVDALETQILEETGTFSVAERDSMRSFYVSGWQRLEAPEGQPGDRADVPVPEGGDVDRQSNVVLLHSRRRSVG